MKTSNGCCSVLYCRSCILIIKILIVCVAWCASLILIIRCRLSKFSLGSSLVGQVPYLGFLLFSLLALAGCELPLLD